MARNTRTMQGGSTTAAEIDAKLDELRSLMVRLRRTAGSVTVGVTIASVESSLARKVAKFSPSGDPDADRSALADLERQARALLLKATRQRGDSGTRAALGTAGVDVSGRQP